MDKNSLKKFFSENDIDLEFINFSEVQDFEPEFWSDKYLIYTSSEDWGFLYKNYIEDIIYYLELSGAKLIPDFKFLKANNNKVFMELLLKRLIPETRLLLNNRAFGCYEEALPELGNLKFPQVYKQSAGAMSSGVGIAQNLTELKSNLKKISRSSNLIIDLKDKLRSLRHPGYQPESRHRNKFVLQDFIPGLDGDYKILIFADKYYVLKRGIKPEDFRASGSGIKLFEKDIPNGILDFAREVFKKLNVPNLSLDIAFNGEEFFLIEFQAIHFGTYTIMRSEFFWKENNDNFELIEDNSILEKEYAKSISRFIGR